MDLSTHVLIVDDEPDVEWLFKQRFRRELRSGKLTLHFAFSGEQALVFLKDGLAANIILVLSDINMPGMTGLDLLKRIKTDFPDVRVHMITAYGDENNYRLAMEFGADGYLTKPLDFEEIRRDVFGL